MGTPGNGRSPPTPGLSLLTSQVKIHSSTRDRSMSPGYTEYSTNYSHDMNTPRSTSDRFKARASSHKVMSPRRFNNSPRIRGWRESIPGHSPRDNIMPSRSSDLSMSPGLKERPFKVQKFQPRKQNHQTAPVPATATPSRSQYSSGIYLSYSPTPRFTPIKDSETRSPIRPPSSSCVFNRQSSPHTPVPVKVNKSERCPVATSPNIPVDVSNERTHNRVSKGQPHPPQLMTPQQMTPQQMTPTPVCVSRVRQQTQTGQSVSFNVSETHVSTATSSSSTYDVTVVNMNVGFHSREPSSCSCHFSQSHQIQDGFTNMIAFAGRSIHTQNSPLPMVYPWMPEQEPNRGPTKETCIVIQDSFSYSIDGPPGTDIDGIVEYGSRTPIAVKRKHWLIGFEFRIYSVTLRNPARQGFRLDFSTSQFSKGSFVITKTEAGAQRKVTASAYCNGIRKYLNIYLVSPQLKSSDPFQEEEETTMSVTISTSKH